MNLLRKHGLWLVIAALAGVVGAGLVYASRPTSYLSTAQVDVEPHIVALTTPVVPNMGTEEQVATSGTVLARTAQVVGMAPGSLNAHLGASVSGTANILSINCTMPAPASAQHCAAAAAASYLAFRNELASSRSERAHDPLHVTLVTEANRPASPAGPGKRILLTLGAFLGLALGLGGIVVRDHFDDRVRDVADLERRLEAPVLAAIPRVRQRGVQPAAVFRQAPLSPAAEAYRYLRARLSPRLAAASDHGTVLLVSSAQPREGRTSVAANTAMALAEAGAIVLLVDADLRHPSLSEVFSTGERPGFADLLTGRASLGEVAVATSVPGLRLVTAGDLTAASADIFEQARLARAFAAMQAIADVVVVDSAPLQAVSDPIMLARVSDLVLVLADVRRTHRGNATAAGQEIRAIGPQVFGVLNQVPRHSHDRERPGVSYQPESLASPAGVPAILASLVPARGTNGQRRIRPDATSAAPPDPGEAGSSADHGPGE
jgi:capsular exopolysaccharide synthesis family protein